MAFSGPSYFAGVGTVVAAIGIGFACGAMIMNDVVQPPNRLERVNGVTAPPKPDATSPSVTSSGPEQAGTAKPAAQDAPPSPVIAAAPSAPAANSQPAPSRQPAAPAAAKTDAATNVQEPPAPAPTTENSALVPVVKSNDQAPAKSERTTVGRAPDPTRDASRKRADERRSSDDRKYSERRRRQDQRQLDEATNVVRQMPRGNAPDEFVEQDDAPRFGGGRPRRFELFEDDDSPRVIQQPPPRFGFFGN